MAINKACNWAAAMMVASLAWLWPSASQASVDFPETIQKYLNMECPPTCLTCHRTMTGGLNTVDKPFGQAMIGASLVGTDPTTVAPALETLLTQTTWPMIGTAPQDSDMDGMGDVDELRAGRDPNVAGEGTLCGPVYGCGARVAKHNPVDRSALALGIAVAGWLLVRSRRRRTV